MHTIVQRFGKGSQIWNRSTEDLKKSLNTFGQNTESQSIHVLIFYYNYNYKVAVFFGILLQKSFT